MTALAFDFDSTRAPLSALTGKYLEEAEADGYSVPFDAWIDNCPRRVLAVLQRTVVYEEPNGDRFIAAFERVSVDPSQIQIRRPGRRSGAQYGHKSMSDLAPRDCRHCGVEFQPLQGGQLYCSTEHQQAAWREKVSAYNREYHQRTKAVKAGIL